MSEPFIGEIRVFSGDFAPRNWALCDGRLLPINQNQALFSILGTTYGGNGVTNFALPDLRGRLPMHAGQGPGLSSYALGQKLGNSTETLLATQLPSHAHALNTRGAASTGTPGAGVGPGATATARVYGTGASSVSMVQSTGQTGGAQPHENRQPYLGLSFIIALFGIFPDPN